MRAAERVAAHARAAFEHYAEGGAVIPSGCVVLAVADLGVLDDCDCELAGRAVASEVGTAGGGAASSAAWGVPWERFQKIVDTLLQRRDEGSLGSPESGEMELAGSRGSSISVPIHFFRLCMRLSLVGHTHF